MTGFLFVPFDDDWDDALIVFASVIGLDDEGGFEVRLRRDLSDGAGLGDVLVLVGIVIDSRFLNAPEYLEVLILII